MYLGFGRSWSWREGGRVQCGTFDQICNALSYWKSKIPSFLFLNRPEKTGLFNYWYIFSSNTLFTNLRCKCGLCTLTKQDVTTFCVYRENEKLVNIFFYVRCVMLNLSVSVWWLDEIIPYLNPQCKGYLGLYNESAGFPLKCCHWSRTVFFMTIFCLAKRLFLNLCEVGIIKI
jgi:hypothetical protein